LLQFALWTALFSGLAWGQIRGGGRAGFSGARVSFHAGVARARAGFGVRYGSPRFSGGFHQSYYSHYYPRYYHRHVRFPYYPYYSYPYYGAYGYGAYYGYAGYYGDPFFWGSNSYDSSNDAYYQQSIAQQQQLQQQVSDLDNEVEQMRAEQEARLVAPPPPPRQPTAAVKPGQPTTLVFRDGKTEDVQNYAVVGRTLWIFSEQRARKIPLDQIDLPTTEKINEDQGVDFLAPK
jgi:hypothetical protein